VWQGLKWMFDGASPFYIRPRLDFGLLAWLGRFAWASRRANCEAAMPVLRDLLAESRRLFDDLATGRASTTVVANRTSVVPSRLV